MSGTGSGWKTQGTQDGIQPLYTFSKQFSGIFFVIILEQLKSGLNNLVFRGAL